jgi:hypothetical protein
MRALEIEVKADLGYNLFGGNGIAEPEDFVSIVSADSAETFERFINVCYRSLIEPIDRAGRGQKLNNFFFTALKEDLPKLFDALYRVRAYRHWRFHSELYPAVRDAIGEYFSRDLGKGKEPSAQVDFLAIQQIVLDELFMAFQEELASLES